MLLILECRLDCKEDLISIFREFANEHVETVCPTLYE